MTLASCDHSLHTLCSVCLFVSLYWFVQEGWLSPLALFVSSTSLTALVFLISLTMDTVDKKKPGLPCCHTCSCAPVLDDSMLRSHSQTIVGGIWEQD